MKKDIDLLGGFNEAKGKKSSGNSSIIMVLGVLIIIGVMVFMYVTASMEVKEKEDIIAGLDNELKKEQTIAPTKKKIEQEKGEYQALVQEILLQLNSGVAQAGGASEISSKLFNVIFDDYITKYHNGTKDEYVFTRVKIDAISIANGQITLNCSTKNWKDAWGFVEYLSGDAVEPPKSEAEGGYVPTDEDKKQFAEQVKKNKDIFKNVQDSYPGLPQAGEADEYSVTFTLTFEVAWEELA